ncbi:MAG: DNA polymerase III subunit alpha [Anaerolineae bacterium]|nr:DNA polymerase III subunit alpha [Anaerolineae bacterium]
MLFTHLQVHSHYSLLEATATIDGLVGYAAAAHLTHLPLTDSNALYGALAFAKACRAIHIQPIIGLTLAVARPEDTDTLRMSSLPDEAAGRLVLLAANPAGYRSLCCLSSLVQGSPERETLIQRGVGWEALKAHREGVICLSGGRQGWLERLVRQGDRAAASRYAAKLAGLYGDRAYISLEIHHPDDEPITQELAALGRRFGLPVAAAQPIYCLTPDETTRLPLLAAIRQNRSLGEVGNGQSVVSSEQLAVGSEPSPVSSRQSPSLSPLSPQPSLLSPYHWLSPEEVQARFHHLPEAISNIDQIIAHCEPALPDGRPIWPVLDLPQGQTPAEALVEQAKAGLMKRVSSKQLSVSSNQSPISPSLHLSISPLSPQSSSLNPHSYLARLDHELTAINQHGYAPLFLIVADAVRYAREQGIPVSTRGSVANCLVAYCLGITTVDPIEHDLLFERFLTPARANPPDIDLDFCSRRRDEVLHYLRQKYGPDRVALVATVNTLQPKSAIRETAKAYGLDEAAMARLAANVPRGWHPDPRQREAITLEKVQEGLADGEKEVVAAAFPLIGQPHHLSVHPGGVVITPGPLTDILPVQWTVKGFLITQFDHQDVEALGLVKLDLLGIRALTVIARAAALIQRTDPTFDPDNIPDHDPATSQMLRLGETVGVFQCESTGAQRTLRQLQARSIHDLAVANAFFKPGPAMGGMARHFIRRYRGDEAVTFLHPALEPILGQTQGVLLFQEQVLRLAREIAGLSWQQADHLRRGMSKFQAEEMAAMQEAFVNGCQRPGGPGLSQQQAETLWEQIMPFAGYGFNQGHATAYAHVSYRSAYLKAHYPAQFLCARLSEEGGYHHPAMYIAEAQRLGIEVRPPHINHSGHRFTLAWEQGRPILWMGLGQVRDLRHKSIAAITQERARHPFASLRDLFSRVSLQKKEVTHLIQCGGLQGLGSSRSALLADWERIERGGSAGQMSFLFHDAVVAYQESAEERLAWEKRLLGWPVSVTPLDSMRERLGKAIPLSQLAQQHGQKVLIAGYRLPGWTGGDGFYLGDGSDYVVVKPDRAMKMRQSSRTPKPWQPVGVRGRVVTDEWDDHWFAAEAIHPIEYNG